ncbi:M24 family metallopeptidase [Leptospira kmetyi]|uniref:M24 family metallopeptidase n=1 Tax=Leptospira kmetyi TaxID=408139 RepID=UPI00028860A9|nr:M24 family metallopeptidase [Leptospira kmetyi]EQA54577.1 metallopeptidase family M24 [Leptospira kmetyi serovar Malaysia str. Bejo-Iso9]TGK19533.1 M24 family metallopeptidase [Leptospira kmetyi]TGK26474.1 M24 family metallopeptidase [Leptospira kmetyi]
MPIETERGILSRFSSKISKYSSRSVHLPTEEEKSGFLKAQRLAYRCVTEVEKEMREGWTELQAAKRMETFLRDHGVKVFLHRPFAWFGEHARFDGYKRYTQFHPGKKKLTAHEPFILDVSPGVDGYIGDIGYSSCLSPSEELDFGMKYLLELRKEIPKYFSSSMSASEIWWKIDRDSKERGFDNVHSLYPFAVLGHRVYKVHLPNFSFPLLPISFASWFSLQGSFEFLSHKVLPELLTPDHEGDKTGLWAIEPHFGRGKAGFKFEEILVVEKDRAYWLDDEVPHVKRAAQLARKI